MEYEEREEIKTNLKEFIKPKDTVYTILRHVSKSGMRRVISLFVIRNGKPYRLDYFASKLLNLKYSATHNGLIVDGCGMDMGFHLVYKFSRELFAEEAEEAKNEDAGYWLNQEWL
jgi:hypothetical protein